MDEEKPSLRSRDYLTAMAAGSIIGPLGFLFVMTVAVSAGLLPATLSFGHLKVAALIGGLLGAAFPRAFNAIGYVFSFLLPP